MHEDTHKQDKPLSCMKTHINETNPSVEWLDLLITVKILKIQTPEKFAVIALKFEQGSGCALFAETYLSENLG